jgi:hypothetical protein
MPAAEQVVDTLREASNYIIMRLLRDYPSLLKQQRDSGNEGAPKPVGEMNLSHHPPSTTTNGQMFLMH